MSLTITYVTTRVRVASLLDMQMEREVSRDVTEGGFKCIRREMMKCSPT